MSKLEKGNELLKQQKFQEAIPCFTEIIDKERSDVSRYPSKAKITTLPALLGRGRAYYYIGLYDESEKDFNLALNLDPDDPMILRFLLAITAKRAEYEAVIKLQSNPRLKPPKRKTEKQKQWWKLW